MCVCVWGGGGGGGVDTCPSSLPIMIFLPTALCHQHLYTAINHCIFFALHTQIEAKGQMCNRNETVTPTRQGVYSNILRKHINFELSVVKEAEC